MDTNPYIKQFVGRIKMLSVGQSITFSDPVTNGDYVTLAVADIQTNAPEQTYSVEVGDELVTVTRNT